jgi:isopropylmalate/homocitrate/citramalate synthase
MSKAEIAPANALTSLLSPPRIEQPLELWDQTLRDGEQTPRVAFTREEKQEIAALLDRLGMSAINVGYPAVSTYEAETVRSIARMGLKAQLGVTARLVRKDFEAAASTGVQWVLCFASLSDWHLRDKLKMTEDEYLKQMQEVLPYGRQQGLRVAFAVEDGTRTPPERLLRFIAEAQNLGAECIRICDTVGVLTPSSTRKLFELLRPFVKVKLNAHFHDDLGMGTANTLTALEAGADSADVAAGGLGERAGNTPLEEVVVALRVKYGRAESMDLSLLPQLSTLVSRYSGMPVAPNRPIVGENVFSHESGIHVAGVLANPVTYEPFPPAWVGRKHRIIFGKHSGISGLRYLLERERIELGEDAQRELLERIKEAGQRKEAVEEGRILAWAAELRQPGRQSA